MILTHMLFFGFFPGADAITVVAAGPLWTFGTTERVFVFQTKQR